MSKKATFAAGCFWGVEEAFVCSGFDITTTVGYTGGTLPNPNYRQVCTGTTGHSEAVEICYDPNKTSYDDLLAIFWRCHDPTLKEGSQYRSAIFFHDSDQQKAALASLENERPKHEPKRIVTDVVHAPIFYPAEDHHQKYYRKHSSSCAI